MGYSTAFIERRSRYVSLPWWQNFWMKTNRKSEFALFQTSTILFKFIWFVKWWRNFLGLNPKGPYLSLEKEKENSCFVLVYLIKQMREIRKFHVAVVQRRLRRTKIKSVMHAHSCCFADINLLLFCRSRCRRRRRCLSSLMLWSRNFATMVTWRHTCPLYCSHAQNWILKYFNNGKYVHVSSCT